jgi:peptidoglycan/LPS O-acetylase OafA/YrhL
MLSSSTDRFRPDIEGLRAIAVVAVILFHLEMPAISGGFLGVDVFYVISGYLITGMLVRELRRTGRIGLIRFYTRRIRRLVPAALLVSLTTLAVGAFVFSPLELEQAALGAAASAAYVSNIWFLLQSFDYFSADAAGNPFLHTWSLAVEEQFYLIWPTLLWGTWRLSRGRIGLFSGALLGYTLLSLAASYAIGRYSGSAAFYLLPSRAWQFGAGALGMLYGDRLMGLDRRWLSGGGWIALIVLVGTFFVFNSLVHFPGWRTLIPVGATVALLVAGARHAGPASMLSLPSFQYLGRLSYSLYLWHWPVIVLLRTPGHDLTSGDRIVAVLLTWVLSELGFRLVEDPIRRGKRFTTKPAHIVFAGLACAMIGAGTAMATHQLAAEWAATPAQQLVSIAAVEQSPLLGKEDKCLVLLMVTKPAPCGYGPAGAPVIVVLGDSHAAQWTTPLASFAQEKKARLLVLAKVGCPVADVTLLNDHLQRPYTECSQWRAQALRSIAALRPRLIVVAEHDFAYLNPAETDAGSATADENEWQAALRRTLGQLKQSAASVVLLSDNPWPRFNVATCLARARAHGWSDNACDFPSLGPNDAHVLALGRQAAQDAGVFWIDMARMQCPSRRCPAIIDGIPAYRDDDHVSHKLSVHFEPRLSASLLPAWQQA